jgi:DNA polymerase III subunit beta
VLLQCNAPTTPAILTPVEGDQFTYLVMPVQIRS